MATDSLIRLRQLNQNELFIWVNPIISGILAQTGILSGVFYPLNSNPKGYELSGAFIDQQTLDSAITQLTVAINQEFYPNSNPSGFTTGTINTGLFYPISNPNGYTSGSANVDGPNYHLNGLGNNYTLDWKNCVARDVGFNESIDWTSRFLGITGIVGGHATTIAIVDWGNIVLNDSNDNVSLDWNNRLLYDFNENVSQDYNNRLLYNVTGGTTLDYNNSILLGNWTGQNVVTSSIQASSYIASGGATGINGVIHYLNTGMGTGSITIANGLIVSFT